MTEEILNQAVWDAVAGVVLNPHLIADRIKALIERRRSTTDRTDRESHDIDRALTDLGREEERLIEAYRTAILSAPVLGSELAKLADRRSALEARSRAVSSGQSAVATEHLPHSVEDFLRQAAPRLSTFTATERQRFLRLILNSVVFEGTRARILGRIPAELAASKTVADAPTNEPPTRGDHSTPTGDDQSSTVTSPAVESLLCRIAPMAIEHYGRNPSVEFELTTLVDPDRHPNRRIRPPAASCRTVTTVSPGALHDGPLVLSFSRTTPHTPRGAPPPDPVSSGLYGDSAMSGQQAQHSAPKDVPTDEPRLSEEQAEGRSQRAAAGDW